MHSVDLRSETPDDYPQIDHVVELAFGRRDEAELVRVLRESQPGFDPRLSIIAAIDEQVIGHLLMTPCDIRLMGETVRAVCVAPVGVLPGFQGRGVGGSLLEHGHRLAAEAGFVIAFLHGHPTYYPRHGYRPAMGSGEISIDMHALEPPTISLHSRPADKSDTRWLAELCERELSDVDFGWLWADDIRSWRLEGVDAHVWCNGSGEAVGFTAAKPGAERLALLLARDRESALGIVKTIRPISISAHPSGWLAREVLDVDLAHASLSASDAAMAIELQEGILAPYFAAVAGGHRPVGAVNHPLVFVLVD